MPVLYRPCGLRKTAPAKAPSAIRIPISQFFQPYKPPRSFVRVPPVPRRASGTIVTGCAKRVHFLERDDSFAQGAPLSSETGRCAIGVVESLISCMQSKISVGILGATGIVGQRFIQLLEGHPWFEVAWLAASDRSEARPYAEAVRWRLRTAIPEKVANMRVSAATPEGAPKVIFAALDASIARELEPRFAA